MILEVVSIKKKVVSIKKKKKSKFSLFLSCLCCREVIFGQLMKKELNPTLRSQVSSSVAQWVLY